MTHFQVGNNVRYISTPLQTGVVYRLNPLGVEEAIVVMWHAGPMFEEGRQVAYFGDSLTMLETY